MNRCLFALLPAVLWLAGCSGSAPSPSSDGTETVRDFGGLSTHLVGTAAPPVLSTSAGSAVIGVAGATFSDIAQSYAAPSLDNTRIAFVGQSGAYDPDNRTHLYSMNADGSGIVSLAETRSLSVGTDGVSWSPDGAKIAFISSNNLYTVNADGFGLTQLTADDFYKEGPSWSPDGTKIAFTSLRSGNGDIYVMNVDGTGLTNLTNDAEADRDPCWSLDGRKIAFSSNRNRNNGDIYSMNPDGTELIQLTYEDMGGENRFPVWSPDGRKIAFMSGRDGQGDIYVTDADGSRPTRLTKDLSLDYMPSWSPDGTKIAFVSRRDSPTSQVYLMNADGSGQTRLVTDFNISICPAWSGYRRPKYVGTNGTLGTACAGFLFGKRGAVNASLLIFDTPTVGARAAARVTANTDPESSSPNLIFTIAASAGISSLKFVNMTRSPLPISPTLPAGTTNALVLFDSATGLVSDVLPYAANRSAGLKPTRVGDNATYSGNFTAVFDGQGKNLAPGGAKSVTLDEKTGKLVAFE